jgi:hypothetical protein
LSQNNKSPNQVLRKVSKQFRKQKEMVKNSEICLLPSIEESELED